MELGIDSTGSTAEVPQFTHSSLNKDIKNCSKGSEEQTESNSDEHCVSSDWDEDHDRVIDEDEERPNKAGSVKKQKLTLYCNWRGCKKVFHKRRHLEDHYRSHTGDRPFVCEYKGCYKAYTKKEHLKRHQSSHDPGTPRFSCPHCNQTYSLVTNLTRHINRTHDEARFQCTIDDCKMSFKKNSQLKNHLSKNHSMRPFGCTYEGCNKQFAIKSHFNRHLKSHKGYDCKVEGCEEHFDTWSLMRKHVAYHNQVSEHTCKTCGKTFPTAQYKAHLKQHKNMRESFLCTFPDCHRAYFDKKNLDIHIKVFHEQVKFACTHEGCQATLVSKQKLKEHMTKIHDPAYVQKQKLKQKKKRKQRMEKHRKEKVVNEVMNLLGNKTEVKFCATSRREFEGKEVGVPEEEVALRVVNEPGNLSLMDIVAVNSETAKDNDSENSESDNDPAENNDSENSESDNDPAENNDSENSESDNDPAENCGSSGLGMLLCDSDHDSDSSEESDVPQSP